MGKLRTPRTITVDEDQAGGRTTYNADDGYLAWQDGVCLGSVTGSDEARSVCSDYRIAQRRKAADPAPFQITHLADPAYTIALDLDGGDFVVTLADGRTLRGAQSYVEAEQVAQKELGR
jgi:hypothetical protein